MKLCIFFISIVNITYGIIISIPQLGYLKGTTTKSAWTNRTIYQFLSIKYAESPSGCRRFMPPEEFPAWYGVYDATIERPGCPELKYVDDLMRRNPAEDLEDCLTLNVFTPKIPGNADTLLPVMVFIHGGAYFIGNAKHFPPNYLLEKDVVLVVIQYRLGPLGFLSLHTDGMAGNVGLMDQVLALEWVNKYIKNFNGDNKRVTAFGQSAGAGSISLHLLSPIVQPHLFQQVILQSGISYGRWSIEDDPVSVVRGIYNALTNNTNPVDVSVMEKTFKEISVIELFKATLTNFMNNTSKIFNLVSRPVVQKAGTVKYLTKAPEDYLRDGEFRTLPMIAGVCKNDGTHIAILLYNETESRGLANNDEFIRNNLTAYAITFPDNEQEDYSGALPDIFENKYFKEVFDQPTKLKFADVAKGVIQILDVFTFKAPTLKQAKLNSQSDATFLYTFDYHGLNTRFAAGVSKNYFPFDGGVSHDDDLLYLFPYHYTTPLDERDTEMAKLMTDLWTNFAINGKPSSSRMNIEWPVLNKNINGPYLHINSIPYIGNDFVVNEYFLPVTNNK